MSKIPYLKPLREWDEFDFENSEYTVEAYGERVFVHNARVDMHDVHISGVCILPFYGETEVVVTRKKPFSFVNIRPESENIAYFFEGRKLVLKLKKPVMLSIEFDGDRFGNLHLFASEEESLPCGRRIERGIHRGEDIAPREGETLVFLPGLHYVEETILRAASGSRIYLSFGAVLIGSIVCENVSGVEICGSGIIDLHSFERYSAFRGVKIVNSENVRVRGVAIINPPHYSIYIGRGKNININSVKCFSSEGWSDGIDIMASSDIVIENVFMRNSDDCVAIYASRWQHEGGTKNVTVKDSVLWADVAHPMNMGVHGKEGDVIENVLFENITVLNHHEPQENYRGVMAITAGDGVLVKNAVFKNITVEKVEKGRLLDVRVVKNSDYNSISGRGIENVVFENISSPPCGEASVIAGFSEECRVTGAELINVSGEVKVGKFADVKRRD